MGDTSNSATSPLKAHLALSPQDERETRGKELLNNREYETLYFDSCGTRCEAWLLRPSPGQPAPLVIMAHGFAGEKHFGLLPFAQRFAERGLAVLLFDYRHFGGSGGEPRNLVGVRLQQQDWQAALDFAGTLPGIDPARIALWGTSLSGGHALTCAVDNPKVAAVVAQVPMVDVPGSLRGYTTRYALQAAWHSLLRLLKVATGRPPHMVPVVGTAPQFAFMNKPGCEAGYRRLVSDAHWANTVPARGLLKLLLHRPGRKACRVDCPTLLLLAAGDQLVPRRTIHRVAARMRDVAVVSLGGDHFDAYSGGSSFERAVRLEADFLERVLLKTT